jgi:hypothetical protein
MSRSREASKRRKRSCDSAEHNPVTVVSDASRALYNGRDPGADPWIALLWAAGITIVFATLSMRRYRSTTSR